MKTLYLLRHAKSSWEDSKLTDFDRPLNERGMKAAPFMGEVMVRYALEPELIVSSPAVRARDTAILAKKAAGLSAEIRYKEEIYEATPQTLLQVVRSIDDEIGSAMIVGHNPGMEGFVRFLTGKSESMPTASLAVIDLNIDDWEQASADTGSLRNIFRPKDEMKMFCEGN